MTTEVYAVVYQQILLHKLGRWPRIDRGSRNTPDITGEQLPAMLPLLPNLHIAAQQQSAGAHSLHFGVSSPTLIALSPSNITSIACRVWDLRRRPPFSHIVEQHLLSRVKGRCGVGDESVVPD